MPNFTITRQVEQQDIIGCTDFETTQEEGVHAAIGPAELDGDIIWYIDANLGFIVDLMNFKNDVIWQENGQLGLNKKHCDNSKLKKLVPDFKFTPFREGLKKTIDWYLKQKEIEEIDETL